MTGEEGSACGALPRPEIGGVSVGVQHHAELDVALRTGREDQLQMRAWATGGREGEAEREAERGREGEREIGSVSVLYEKMSGRRESPPRTVDCDDSTVAERGSCEAVLAECTS